MQQQQQMMGANQGQTAVGTMMKSPNMNAQLNHGGHEVLDVSEAISSTISLIDTIAIFSTQIKDPALKTMLTHQQQFLLDQYNILVEAFTTGKDPSHPTSQYKMQQENDVIYGLKPSQPKKPSTTANITDEYITGVLLNGLKLAATSYTLAAMESTNPVVRRILADSLPNIVELAYELFLYQNKKGNYQVPQFAMQDMNQLMNSYTTSANTNPMLQ